MCGIVGVITKRNERPSEDALRVLSDAIKHRGPDGDGYWIQDGVGLAHRRLAIIDLSERGKQPMQSADGRFTITYNGEIYNYLELRKICEDKGSRFQSDTDTEVILELYRYYGKDCVLHLRGMFAFGIWDRVAGRLFFARDRAGKKPFFYRTLANGSHTFASEIKALRNIEPVTIDHCALRLFFGLQYVPSPRTGFREIHSLPPGMRGYMDEKGIETESYCDWSSIAKADGDYATRLRTIFDEAVRIRLRADVTVGAFLSGGIDSAAVVGIAQKHISRPIRTFTMGFPNIHMDERKEALETARYFGTDHQEFEAQPEDLIALTEKIIFQYGGPYADSSALPVMMLSRMVAQEIKVVLVGDGGDELFGGYRRYQAFRRASQLSHIPGSRHVLSPLLHVAGGIKRDPRFSRMADTLRATCDQQSLGYAELFCGSYFHTKSAKKYLRPEFLEARADCDPVAFICERMGNDGHPLDRAMRFDFESYLADDLNPKMDRATMAYGLEARAPFLDQELIAFALGLPLKEKMAFGKGKLILRRALKDILPEKVLYRPKKGFQVPLAEWFRSDLSEYWKDHCLDSHGPLADFANVDAISQLFEENRKGADHGNRLWMLLSLAVWLDGISC